MKPKRIKRTADTEEEARKKAKNALEIWEKQQKEKSEYKYNRRMTFGEFVEDFINVVCAGERRDRCGESTILNYRQNYNQYIKKYSIDKMQVSALTKKTFQNYYDRLTLRYAPKSISVAVSLCKRTCEWLVERKILEDNYAAQARPVYPKEESFEFVEQEQAHKTIFSEEDIGKFLEGYQKKISEYATVAFFLLEAGIRPQEFPVIKKDDFDFEAKTLHIVRALGKREGKTGKTESYVKCTKTGEDRYIKLSDFCVGVAQEMLFVTETKCKNNPDNWFYPSFRNGKYRSLQTMEVGVKNLCNLLNIDRDVHVTRAGASKGSKSGSVPPYGGYLE